MTMSPEAMPRGAHPACQTDGVRPTSPPVRRVAIQGERGAFSHSAACAVFGNDVSIVPSRSFDDLFQAVVSGAADRGVVPVENTLAGSVQRNLDLLLQNPLHVVGETRLPIRLCLVAPPGRRLEELGRAASHPVALEQCTGFFRDHPTVERVAVYDTAGGVRDLMAGSATYEAAIGPELAASLYGASVLLRNIEDDPENFTRFFVVSRESTGRLSGRVKTSIAFVVPHNPGSLHRALGVIAARGVDLTKLESRPIPGRPWEYRFFADLRGVPMDQQRSCLEDLRAVALEVTELGWYEES